MVGWRLSRLFGFLFTCPIVAHFPKEDFSVFFQLKTLVVFVNRMFLLSGRSWVLGGQGG